jgi:hypothetical protein
MILSQINPLHYEVFRAALSEISIPHPVNPKTVTIISSPNIKKAVLQLNPFVTGQKTWRHDL